MQAVEATRSCKVMLVVGTSAIVYPAADMPAIARQAGARVIEINPEPTSLTGWVSDYIILGKAGEILPALVEELKKMAL
mgnify:FL=1